MGETLLVENRGEVAVLRMNRPDARNAVDTALRTELIRTLEALATDDEVLGLVERRSLVGRGIGWVDAHLLASTLLSPGVRLETRDRRLSEVAGSLGIG